VQENESIAISCRGVHKHFGDRTRVQALRGVDFEPGSGTNLHCWARAVVARPPSYP